MVAVAMARQEAEGGALLSNALLKCMTDGEDPHSPQPHLLRSFDIPDVRCMSMDTSVRARFADILITLHLVVKPTTFSEYAQWMCKTCLGLIAVDADAASKTQGLQANWKVLLPQLRLRGGC